MAKENDPKANGKKAEKKKDEGPKKKDPFKLLDLKSIQKLVDTSFLYFEVKLYLFREMLGTCPAVSIYEQHVLQKNIKEIADANRQHAKLTKLTARFWGSEEIPEEKQIAEIQGLVKHLLMRLGKADTIPDERAALLDYAKELEEEWSKKAGKAAQEATVFIKDKETGLPMISGHMILGNLKENLRVEVNTSTIEPKHRIVKSKVQAGEISALDVKTVEAFLHPTMDIERHPPELDEKGEQVTGADGKPERLPKICERPIHFEDKMGKQQSAIAMSEVLPEGTEFKFHLRVRAESPFARKGAELLLYLLACGRNNGLGSWRGSGHKGAFYFDIKQVDGDPSDIPKGYF